MKIKQDFVTNSSSSSFIVKLSDITELQKYQILNHYEVAKEKGWLNEYCSEGDAWSNIEEKDGELIGSTYMDNFDMEEFMEKIGVNVTKAKFDD
jgi:hypothetical protein